MEFIDSYTTYIDEVKNETTSGTNYVVKLPGDGTYELQVTSTNPYGESAMSSKITVVVEGTETNTTIDTNTDPPSDVNSTGIIDFFTDPDNWLLIGGIAGGLIILIIVIAIVVKKKGELFFSN